MINNLTSYFKPDGTPTEEGIRYFNRLEGKVGTSGPVTASGAEVAFTGIPATATRIVVMFAGLSTNGSSVPIIQLGDSGGFETSGYLGAGTVVSNAAFTSNSHTAGCGLSSTWASTIVVHGSVNIDLIGSNQWTFSGTLGRSDAAAVHMVGSSKTLSGVLDRVRVRATNGTDTFDAGTIAVRWFS